MGWIHSGAILLGALLMGGHGAASQRVGLRQLF
jgi:hypothetical protein